MTMVKVYNQKGKETDEMQFPKSLIVEWNPELVHQVVNAIQANKRNPTAHTKNRGEVSGGGKKPWKQKGTGRARHGSIRSPLWKGGGTTFGPRSEKDYSQKINKKMSRAALLSVISKKVSDGELKVIESFDLPTIKTKPAAEIIKNILKGSSAVLVAMPDNKNFKMAARNLPKTKVLAFGELNVYDLLTHKEILVDKKVLEKYE
ncbi:MAG: 50S ribosomal protein L4 [Candidatus Pacebacteria bacterium]|nr:50S ribosomal protein L4 [Candidatus Paceibacterota bacterium]